MNATPSLIVVGIIGLGSGVAGAALLGELRSSQAPAQPVTERVIEVREAHTEADKALIEGLQRELFTQKRILTEQAQQRSVDSPKESTPADPAQMRYEREQDYDVKIRNHLSEETDAGWAAAVSTSLKSDIGSKASGSALGKFIVTQVECRSHTCVAELDWDSFDAARDGYGALLTTRYEQACSVETVLPEPSDSAQRYTSKMLFTCR